MQSGFTVEDEQKMIAHLIRERVAQVVRDRKKVDTNSVTGSKLASSSHVDHAPSTSVTTTVATSVISSISRPSVIEQGEYI